MLKITRDKSPTRQRHGGNPRKRWCDNKNNIEKRNGFFCLKRKCALILYLTLECMMPKIQTFVIGF